MAYGRRSAYIGASEVNNLIGKWQQIVGGGPWQQIVGADVSYNNPYAQRNPYAAYNPLVAQYRRHHRRHPWQTQQYGQYNQPYQAPYVAPYAQPYQAPYAQPYYAQAPYVPPVSVRDHRRACLEHQAYVRGDSVALGSLALMGAEDAAAAATGVPPVDATIPAQGPPPLDMANMGPMGPPPDAGPPPMGPPMGPPDMGPPQMPPPPMGPQDMGPPPQDLGPPEHRHRHHRHWRERGGQSFGFPPRNALVDYPGPSRAERVVLPMSSGVNILPNTSAQITSRPQTVAFRPERMIIGGNAGDWIINDIRINGKSQLRRGTDIPGEMFSATTIDSIVSFETVQVAMDFVVLVTFVGASDSGAPFICGVLGNAEI